MKEKMLAYLQELLDRYKAEREDGFLDFAKEYIHQFEASKVMYEAVTGEKVTIQSWKVVSE